MKLLRIAQRSKLPKQTPARKRRRLVSSQFLNRDGREEARQTRKGVVIVAVSSIALALKHQADYNGKAS